MIPRALLAAALLPAIAGAQSPPTAPLAGSLAGSTRGAAMGNTLVAGREDDALFLNPAQAAIARGMSAQAHRFGTAATALLLSSAMQSGRYGFGVGAMSLAARLPDADRHDVTAIPRGSGPLVESRAAFVAVARTVFGVRMGASAKYLEERDATTRRGWTVADVGASRNIGRGAAAVSVQNIGRDDSGDEPRTRLPLRGTMGYNIGPIPVLPLLDLAFGAALQVDRVHGVVPGAGAELGYVWLDGYALALRAGVRRAVTERQGYVVGGLGFTRDNVSLDYAFEPGRGVPHVHRVGLRVR